MPLRLPKLNRIALAAALVGALGAVTAFGVDPIADAQQPPSLTVVEPVALQVRSAEAEASFLQSELVRRGDTLAAVLARLGANDVEMLAFAASDPIARKALVLRPGRSLRAEIDSLGRILRLAYRVEGLDDRPGGADSAQRLLIRRGEDGRLSASFEAVTAVRSTEMRAGEIRTTLFAAADSAGIPEAVAVQLTEVFGGEVDLQSSLRRGDRFRVIYEALREPDSFDAPVAVKLLAAELLTGGKSYRALWFPRADGGGDYHDFDGRALRRDFLLNPLEVTRVSSGFTEARLHPIARDWRAHRGIDFSAPIGTRVRAVADGKVEYAGRQRGYGNVVILNHAGDRSSLYAHLQDFAPGVRAGAAVNQGDILGSVGMTGWSTGPHLHFELRIAGEHVDPATVVASVEPRVLKGSERAAFGQKVADAKHRLSLLSSLRTASFQ